MAEYAASEKACVFITVDCLDGDECLEFYNMCIKFGSVEKCEFFMVVFNDV